MRSAMVFLGLSSDCTEEQEKILKDTRQNSQEKWLQRIASYQIKVKQTDPNLETEKLSKVSHFDIKMNIGGQ